MISQAISPPRHRDGIGALVLLIAAPAALALVLTVFDLIHLLPTDLWRQAFSTPDTSDPAQLLYRYAFLPRVAASVLAGAALGLAGVIMQHVLRNPLAEPTTIGTNAGASLALAAATLYAPWLLEGGREGVALAGGTLATSAVFALARGRAFSPASIIIAGLVVSLTFGSAGALLMALNREYTEELFIWQSGSLAQNGDAAVIALAPWLLAGICAAFMLWRPLQLLDLSDDGAASLGTRPAVIRLAGMAVAVSLSALVVAEVGVIGFVALAAPALVRLAGARTLARRMMWSPLAGAALLWLTDRLVQHLPFAGEVPAGTATALLGAPLLLFLLPRMRTSPEGQADIVSSARLSKNGLPLIAGLLVLILAVAVAVGFGRGAGGWHWIASADLTDLLALRAPRVVVALSAGVLLAVAGTLMQRMTGNPMAAPEVLGISGGASFGVLAMLLITDSFDRTAMLGAALAGALLALTIVVLVGRRNALSPERLLLAGVAVATVASAFAALLLASGDPRMDFLLAWLSGSTYRATPMDAFTAATVAVAVLALAPLTARWLDILPLGEITARGLGLRLGWVRATLLALTALATATATLVIGPLSFVGLMAPHLARMLGFRRAVPQLLASAIAGGLILVAADWAGRTLIFPWQVPAGLIAAFVGGPYFTALMWKGRQ
ncbi:MAG: Fe(3+)-hydroxamate ABC transporter permease FhuB [Mesorhizobium sp.]|uniref:Fe(3+)-hydroxamate ABC transporter permease FhuB n=1 Tax=Mesorhizobium sp. TaxID=1871066 RepID=UPI000FE6AD19|nr:Fe(3+)-hydroxamate ABC transporter permease FhuB [Mesorhizobium sp.]RWP86781.1 MAG: Fe(3+)-hydroxamate ABC transporter permease FhuB [Mesorhizobium sp.]